MNPYYQQGTQTRPRLSAVKAKIIAPDPLPNVFNKNRVQTQSGGNNATVGVSQVVNSQYHRWRWDGSGSATIHWIDGNGVAQVTPVSNTTFTFFNLDNIAIPFLTAVVGSGALLGPSGSAPSNSYVVSLLVSFPVILATNTTVHVDVRNSSGTLVKAVNLFCPAGSTSYPFNNNFNTLTGPGTGYSGTVTGYTPAAITVFDYYVVPAAPFAVYPVSVHYKYGVDATPANDVIGSVTYNDPTQAQLFIKQFSVATDPDSHGTWTPFTITGVFSQTGSALSGWTYEFKNPFVLLGVIDFDPLTSGGAAFAFDTGCWVPQPYLSSLAGTPTFWPTFKFYLNKANANGIKTSSDITPIGISLIESDLSRQYEKFLKPLFGSDILPESGYSMLSPENILMQVLRNKSTVPVDVNNPDMELLLNIASKIASLTDTDQWGAPGLYFVPDETGLAVQSPYWTGLAALQDGGIVSFLVLELKSIS